MQYGIQPAFIHLTSFLDNKDFAGILRMDRSNAFDCLPHQLIVKPGFHKSHKGRKDRKKCNFKIL